MVSRLQWHKWRTMALAKWINDYINIVTVTSLTYTLPFKAVISGRFGSTLQSPWFLYYLAPYLNNMNWKKSLICPGLSAVHRFKLNAAICTPLMFIKNSLNTNMLNNTSKKTSQETVSGRIHQFAILSHFYLGLNAGYTHIVLSWNTSEHFT